MKQQLLTSPLQKPAQQEVDEVSVPCEEMQKFLDNEQEVWIHAKKTQFFESLTANRKEGTPLPLNDWIRLTLQFDTSLSLSEVFRIVEEEDSMLAMSSVRLLQPEGWADSDTLYALS